MTNQATPLFMGPTVTTATPMRGLAMIPTHELKPSPNNPRERLNEINELASSIAEVGIIQPIVVQRLVTPGADRFQIITGHRRHAAAIRLKMAQVPCLIRRDMLPDEELMSLPIQEQEELRAGQVTIGSATASGRLASGRVKSRAKGKKSAQYLSVHHRLSNRVKARCQRLAHKSKGAASVGGIGCGECWEVVIRADERDHLHDVSHQLGHCALCQHPTQPTTPGAHHMTERSA